MQIDNVAQHSANKTIPQRHVVITVHGIRTFADWCERLRKLLQDVDRDVEVERLDFGYFSLLFLIPWFRKPATERYAEILLHTLRSLRECRVDIVAHSFGTLVVATALERIKRESTSLPTTPLIENLILAGSVLTHKFKWHEFTPFVGRVTNDCGIYDVALLGSMGLLRGLGYAGRRGFEGMQGRYLLNRFFEFGHSGYFEKDGNPNDEFMRRYWIPILTTDMLVEEVPDPRHRSKYPRLIAWLETYVEPIKLGLYFAIIAAPLIAGCWMYRQKIDALSLAQANLQAAHSLAATSLDGSDAMQASLLAAADHDSPEINSALKANVDIATQPVSWLSHQSATGIEIATAHPLLPIVAVSFGRAGKSLVSIIDAKSGKELNSFFGARDNSGACNISAPTSLQFSATGKYLTVESLDGVCIWSMEKKKIVFSDVARDRARVSPDENFVILVDGMESKLLRTDVLDFSTGKIQALNLKLASFDDNLSINSKGIAYTEYNQLVVYSYATKEIHKISLGDASHFVKLFASPSGEVAMGVTNTGEIDAVSIGTGQVLWKKTVGQELQHASFSADEKLIATQLGDGASEIWRSSDGGEVLTLKTTGFPEGIQFVGDSSILVLTHNRRHDLKIWNLATRTLWRKIPTDPYQTGFAVTADGRYVVNGGMGETAVVWDVMQSENDARRLVRISSEVQHIALDSAAQKLLIQGNEGDITLWDMNSDTSRQVSGKKELTLPFLQNVAVDKKGKMAVVETASGEIEAFDLTDGKERWKYALPSYFSLTSSGAAGDIPQSVETQLLFDRGPSMPIICPEKSPFFQGRHDSDTFDSDLHYVTRTCATNSVDAHMGRRQISTQSLRGSFRISPSGKFVLIPILDIIVVLSVDDGHFVTGLSVGFDRQADDPISFELSDGTRFARLRDIIFLDDDSIAAITHGNSVWVWRRIGNGYKEGIVKTMPMDMKFEAFSGAMEIAYFFDTRNGNVVRLDVKSMQQASIDDLPQINDIFVDQQSDKRRIAVVTSAPSDLIVSGEGPVRVPYRVDIWDERKSKKIAGVTLDGPVKRVAFSASGIYIAISDGAGAIRVYSIEDGAERARIQRDEQVNTLAFVGGDKYILSATGPTGTFPSAIGADAVQLDVWKTVDLLQIACKVQRNDKINLPQCRSSM